MDSIIKDPKITVFMAAYNAEAFIGEAISSILSQSFNDFELLIVNDGSTDNTTRIIHSFEDPRIRLIHNSKNMGLVYTRNRALEEARGTYLAVLDSDDIAVPQRLQWQYEFMEQHPGVALCGGHAQLIDKNGHPTGEQFIEPVGMEINSHMLFGNPFINSSTIFKTEVLKELKGYRDFAPAEDFDFFLRVADKYPVANVDHLLVQYRIHDSNTSAIKPSTIRAIETDILKDQYSRWDVPVDDHFVHLHYYLFSRNYDSITFKEILLVLNTLKQINRSNVVFPKEQFEWLLFDKWYEIIVIKKAGRSALPLLFRRELFDFSYLTFKQFRRAFKQSLRGYLNFS